MTAKCTDSKTGSLLHAYEMGALDEPDLSEFEQHLLSCDACYRSLQDWEARVTMMRTDTEFAEAAAAATREHQHEQRPSLWARLWPRRSPLLLRPGVAYLAALGLLIVLFVSRPWDAGSGIREARVIYLSGSRDAGSPAYTVDPGDPLAITFHVNGGRFGRTFTASLTRDGAEIFHDSQLKHLDELGTGTLLLPPKTARPGSYQLALIPTDSASVRTGDTVSFAFRIVASHR